MTRPLLLCILTRRALRDVDDLIDIGVPATTPMQTSANIPARKKKSSKRGSFRVAKKDKSGINDGPSGPPEWADPDPDVPFLSRTVAEKKLEACDGVSNGSFVVRQTKSVVKGYVVTSCFDGNMANSQLKNKGEGTNALYYGGVKVGDTLEEALLSLQTSTKVSSIGGIEPYLLTHRISVPVVAKAESIPELPIPDLPNNVEARAPSPTFPDLPNNVTVATSNTEAIRQRVLQRIPDLPNGVTAAKLKTTQRSSLQLVKVSGVDRDKLFRIFVDYTENHGDGDTVLTASLIYNLLSLCTHFR